VSDPPVTTTTTTTVVEQFDDESGFIWSEIDDHPIEVILPDKSRRIGCHVILKKLHLKMQLELEVLCVWIVTV
jgi:hypothetical protein